MNILYIGINYNKAISHALAKEADNFAEVGTGGGMDNKIIEAAKQIHPHLTFIHLQGAQEINNGTLMFLKSFGKVFNWTGDVRTPIPKWYYQVASSNVVHTLFSNMRDVKDFKHPCGYLDIGYDENVYYPKSVKKDIDIVFMANNYNVFPNSKAREKLGNLIHSMGGKVYGRGWKFSSGDLNENEQAEADVYRRSKIAVNFSNFTIEDYTSDRMHRILGCGAFCLSHQFKGVEKWGVETFNDNFAERAEYFLKHDTEREEKARVTHEHALKNHTYKAMVHNLFKIYGSI